MVTNEQPRVLIIGAGPAGLTLAHALARHNIFDITVVERDPDPFNCPTTTDRSYTIDITGHGLKAIRYLDAVDTFDRQLLKFRGVRVKRPIRRDVPWTDAGWTGSRGDILRALLHRLNATHPQRVTFRWQTTVDTLNPRTGDVQIDGHTETYDLIVGCDGAGAVTRRALKTWPGFTTEKTSLPNYCMMVALDQNTDTLDPEWLYVMNGHPFTVAGAVNGTSKDDPKWFCMVGFNHEHRFGSASGDHDTNAVDEARRYFKRHTDMPSVTG